MLEFNYCAGIVVSHVRDSKLHYVVSAEYIISDFISGRGSCTQRCTLRLMA